MDLKLFNTQNSLKCFPFQSISPHNLHKMNLPRKRLSKNSYLHKIVKNIDPTHNFSLSNKNEREEGRRLNLFKTTRLTKVCILKIPLLVFLVTFCHSSLIESHSLVSSHEIDTHKNIDSMFA